MYCSRLRQRLPSLLTALSLCVFDSGGPVWADWDHLERFDAIAEVRVDEEAVRLQLRLKGGLFDRLNQGRGERNIDGSPGQWVDRLVRLQDGNEKRLVPLAGKGTSSAVADPQTGYRTVEAQYAQPGRLTRLRLLPGEVVGADHIGLVVLHKGVPVSDLIDLRKPLRLALDWADPWRSRFDDGDLLRRHAEPRSYLYVEPYEVRHEVLLRLADLRSVVDLGLKNQQWIEAGERPDVTRRIGAFLVQKNPLMIDGKTFRPQLDRVEFVGFSRAGIQPVAEGASVDSTAALVGAVLVYLTDQPARQLSLRWELFGQGGHATRAVSVVQGKDSFEAYMTRQHPVFEWSKEDIFEAAQFGEEAEGNGPPVGGELASLQQNELKDLVQPLLHNAYRAFSLREEEMVYDRLAKTLADPLLEDIYLQQRRTQLQQAKGLGGDGRVERIDVLDAQRIDRAANLGSGHAQLDVRWKAQGSVSHWGHSHPRDNLYSARLSLQRDPAGAWKILGMQFRDGQRLETAVNP